MRPSVIGIIFKKQFIELLRDKRTIFVIFVLPILLYPLMIVGFTQMSIFMLGKMERETFNIAIDNREYAPQLSENIVLDAQFTVVEPQNPDSALRKGEILLYLKIPENFEDRINEGGSESLVVEFDGANERGSIALERMKSLIGAYKNDIVAKRISEAGLDSNITRPINDNYKNVASVEKMGGMVFGRVIALILVIMVITGAYYPSIDMFSGEKERGTLETLLVSPAGRMEIVLGKYLTVFVMALVNALLNLASMGLTLSVGIGMMGEVAEHLALSINPSTMILILIQLIPLATLFSAIFLAISSFANSYKEAQAYLTPVFLLAELPALAALIPGLKLSVGLSFVPVMNVSLLFKDIMLGEMDALKIVLVWVSTAFYSIVALRWAGKILSDEESLLSQTKEPILSRIFARKKKNIADKVRAGAVDSITLFAVCVSLLLWIGAPMQMKNILNGLIFTELLLIAFPPLVLAKRINLNIKETFRFNMPSLSGLGLAMLISIAGSLIIIQLSAILARFIAVPENYVEHFENLFAQLKSAGSIGGLAIIAFLPAVCEEILFRGYILDGLTRRWGATAGVIASGILFGAFHLDPFRLIPASLLGIIFGFMVIRKNSIFYGMLGHFLNNGLAFLFVIAGEKCIPGITQPDAFLPWWLFFIAVIIFSICFYVFWNGDKRRDESIH